MKPNSSFQNQPSEFWALLKYASEALGYSSRLRSRIDNKFLRRYDHPEIQALASRFTISDNADLVVAYLNYRANLIEKDIFLPC